jgi:hypothetical protein
MRIILTSIFLTFFLQSYSQDLIKSTITVKNAALINTYDINDIESMVTYYFASRVRNDDEWKKVIPDSTEWSSRMVYSLNKHNQWNFVEFKNLGFYSGEHGSGVKVYFKIEVNGHIYDGKDDVELKKKNNRWVISNVPN